MSGSSASPIRSVVWACALTPSASNNAAEIAAFRIMLIAGSLSLLTPYSASSSCLINPGSGCCFRSPKGRDQFFQRRRETAIGRKDKVRRRQLADAVAGGGVAIADQLRPFDPAALDHIGAAGVEAAARGRIECARHLAWQQRMAVPGPRVRHRDRR